MRASWIFVLLVFPLALVAEGAPPLEPGDIVIAGGTHDGSPPGLCSSVLCRIEPLTGAATPISNALPGNGGDVAILNATTVLVNPTVGAAADLLRVDVTTGSFSTLAARSATDRFRELSVTLDGRIFALTNAGIVRIDAMSGAVTLITPGVEWEGLAAEPTGALMTTRFFDYLPPEFPFFPAYEFVRVDPTTGATTPLGDTVLDPNGVAKLEVAASNDRFLFAPSGLSQDGLIHRFRPGVGQLQIWGGEFLQTTLADLAVAPDGSLLATLWLYPGSEPGLVELYRLSPNGGVLASFDYDFAVAGLDVMRNPACADGADNDGDGATDHPTDPGCLDAVSDRENPKCDDGIDNDGDGAIDWDGAGVGPADATCQGQAWGNREAQTSCGLGVELVALLFVLRRIAPR